MPMEKESTNSNGQLLAAKMGDKMKTLLIGFTLIAISACISTAWIAGYASKYAKENERMKIRIENLCETDSILLFELQKCRGEELK